MCLYVAMYHNLKCEYRFFTGFYYFQIHSSYFSGFLCSIKYIANQQSRTFEFYAFPQDRRPIDSFHFCENFFKLQSLCVYFTFQYCVYDSIFVTITLNNSNINQNSHPLTGKTVSRQYSKF